MDSSLTLLIVDDEPDNFDVLEALLFKDGYDLNFAQSGQAALTSLDTSLPDVILLDVMMPELDGIEVCQRIKRNPQQQHIPIIMVTALNTTADLVRCLEAGANDFISKPVRGTELRARVRSMVRIKQQYDSLKAVLRLREDLSRMLVHDLRNPITSIIMLAQLLQLTPLEEKQEQKVDQILTDGLRLRSLTDDLLMIAKGEAGKLTLNCTEVDLTALATQAITDFTSVAEQKQVYLQSVFPAADYPLSLDANLMRRLLDNLIANAIKFSAANSTVTIQITYPLGSENRTKISVFDQGEGVDPQVQELIFEPYETGQLLNDISQIGLGLAFCKLVTEAHGGKIFVEPNHPSGSIFTVEV
jgi:two-component system sensor histidine kinase/response regulator